MGTAEVRQCPLRSGAGTRKEGEGRKKGKKKEGNNSDKI